MEEILSSIKRIIAEEGDAPVAAPPRRVTEPEPDPEILELDDAVADEPFEMADPQIEEISAEEAPALAIAPVAPPAPPPTPVAAPAPAETLVSRVSAEASRQALASLSRMVVRPEEPVADNTLEGLVRELLRPMLKDWLDANLPRIVQATVDREVARISGRD